MDYKPCCICGLPVNARSMGGPDICPSCDCDGTGIGRLKLTIQKQADELKVATEGRIALRNIIEQQAKELERCKAHYEAAKENWKRVLDERDTLNQRITSLETNLLKAQGTIEHGCY